MISEPLWALIALQIAMGAFDTLYHHELTERLVWRSSQQRELKLHALRNGLYSLLFLVLAFLEVHGWWAQLVMTVLLVEVVITLVDFVEEDLTRRLPASERINHTLLTLNYGAVLVLLLPILAGWAGLPTQLVPTFHGLWSGMAALAAGGVALFGLRDFFAAKRATRLTPDPPGDLAAALPERRTVLITGATGFIGSRLEAALSAGGHCVITFARDPGRASAALRPPYWLITSLDQIPSSTHVDAVVNLAGEPIGDGLWTRAKRRRALASRLRTTREVLRLMARLERPPTVLVNGSAIGWYGLRGDEALDETDDGTPCFSHRLCSAWERAAAHASALGVRVVRLRIGLVLGIEGGMLSRLLTPFEFGLGGPLGHGRQWMSWIARDDLVRLIIHAIADPRLEGAVNATAPEPVRNTDFAKALGAALCRPAILRVPRVFLAPLGDFADELLLGGQRVEPRKAMASGFMFRYPDLPGALSAIIGRSGAAREGHASALSAMERTGVRPVNDPAADVREAQADAARSD
jgi:uncharacterized protein (TIGR01777 family)